MISRHDWKNLPTGGRISWALLCIGVVNVAIGAAFTSFSLILGHGVSILSYGSIAFLLGITLALVNYWTLKRYSQNIRSRPQCGQHKPNQ